MEIEIRRAKQEDAEEIFEVMEYIRENMEDKSLYLTDTLEYVKNHIDENGITVVAENSNGKIIGYFITRYPKYESNNLGRNLDLTEEELLKVIHMESTAVLPEYRGNSLQRKMLEYIENEIKDSDFKYYMATVPPNNIPSLNSFLELDYKIIRTIEKYHVGWLRHILLKKV